MKTNRLIAIMAPLLLGLAGCGGGSGGGTTPPPPPPPPPPVTQAEAYQFLNQGSFGATEDEADACHLDAPGGVDRRADAKAGVVAAAASAGITDARSLTSSCIRTAWISGFAMRCTAKTSCVSASPLRCRRSWSYRSLARSVTCRTRSRDYYDVLAKNAFGNYRELLEEVTLHPAMGVYLSMLGNEKPDPVLNIRPDENYAREVMQLFSIGLVELNTDGTEKLDLQGQPIPTYDQEIIEGFAHVYTGWTFAGAPSFRQARPTRFNQVIPMQLYPGFHDTEAKLLLNGDVLPAGQSGEQDLSAALDNIFNHPNVGPFIAIRLIQRLVTSNPSPGYVRRVAEVFNNNGSGVRGDLGGGCQSHSAGCRGQPGHGHGDRRQAQGAAAAPHAVVEGLQRDIQQRSFSVDRSLHSVWPGTVAISLGVQLLQPVLCTAR